MTAKTLVVYGRTSFCPYQRIAQRVFDEHNLSVHSIMIDQSDEARDLVLQWTGFRAVPTLVVANPGETLPYKEPAPLTVESPRGVNRGSIITEPTKEQLLEWLKQHHFID